MRYEKIMAELGYVVRLADGSLNPTAVECDRLLCQKTRIESVMLGPCVAECWGKAKSHTQTTWTIEETDNTSGSGWSREAVGDNLANQFFTQAEALAAIDELAIACGWSRENMRVVELDSQRD